MLGFRPSIALFLIIFMNSCFVATYGQVGKDLSLKDVSGVQLKEDGFVVVGDINLKGKTLVMPKGSKVDFKGGRIFNGTVLFDETLLEGDVLIESSIKGTIINEVIKASWFGLHAGSNIDQTRALQSIVNLYESNVSYNSWDINLDNPEPTIIIPSGRFNVGEITLRSYVTIKGAGRGSTELNGVTFKADKQYNITIEDISIIGNVGTTKKSNYVLENDTHLSAFKLNNCARLIFKNVCIKNYNVAFDMYNTYLVDLYSCFISYCDVCYLNDGKGDGYGGHAVRWYGGEMCDSKYGFVQKQGNGVLLSGATIEGCKYGVNLITPSSFSVLACYFEDNNYDIFGTVVHVNIENNLFSESGKVRGDAYIYAPTAIGFAVIQGNAFGKPIFNNPHILIGDSTHIYGNIMIGQNDIIHGGRIPVSERLLPYISEKGVNKYQTYLPEGNSLLLGQTIIFQDPQTGHVYLVTRDKEGDLKFLLFEDDKK